MSESRDRIRSARFTADEVATIERAAKAAGMSVSAYLRRSALVAALPPVEIALKDYQPTTVGAAASTVVYWRTG